MTNIFIFPMIEEAQATLDHFKSRKLSEELYLLHDVDSCNDYIVISGIGRDFASANTAKALNHIKYSIQWDDPQIFLMGTCGSNKHKPFTLIASPSALLTSPHSAFCNLTLPNSIRSQIQASIFRPTPACFHPLKSHFDMILGSMYSSDSFIDLNSSLVDGFLTAADGIDMESSSIITIVNNILPSSFMSIRIVSDYIPESEGIKTFEENLPKSSKILLKIVQHILG